MRERRGGPCQQAWTCCTIPRARRGGMLICPARRHQCPLVCCSSQCPARLSSVSDAALLTRRYLQPEYRSQRSEPVPRLLRLITALLTKVIGIAPPKTESSPRTELHVGRLEVRGFTAARASTCGLRRSVAPLRSSNSN